MSDPGKDSHGRNLRGIKSRLLCFSYCKTIMIEIIKQFVLSATCILQNNYLCELSFLPHTVTMDALSCVKEPICL